jgi:nucleotide-binding universal stress UspA family protein
MLRNILIGLDGTEDNEAAMNLGLRWAKEFDSVAAGLAVADDPGIIATQAALLFDIYPDGTKPEPLVHRLRERADEIRVQFTRRCEEAGVRYQAREATGSPSARIVEEAERSDLVVLGRPTHFEFGSGGHVGDRTLVNVLHESPRPVVSVPRSVTEGESVVVAYDGSLPAARALTAFQAMGLGRGAAVHVVIASTDRVDAAHRAERTVEFLSSHDLDARPVVVETARHPAEVILEQVKNMRAGLLVMGVHGRSQLRDFFVGSTTRGVLDASPVPVFCHN